MPKRWYREVSITQIAHTYEYGEWLERRAACAEKLAEACEPFVLEGHNRADFTEQNWNVDAHVELTATIAELRAMNAALAEYEAARSEREKQTA